MNVLYITSFNFATGRELLDITQYLRFPSPCHPLIVYSLQCTQILCNGVSLLWSANRLRFGCNSLHFPLSCIANILERTTVLSNDEMWWINVIVWRITSPIFHQCSAPSLYWSPVMWDLVVSHSRLHLAIWSSSASAFQLRDASPR